ncbi:MAG: septum formation initiator family protein [Clostridia bacterium]|nr:septum formation initiator family protein [Clostridia bacterium]
MVESIAQQCDALEAENAELEAMLESGDKDAYIERVARENGYVKPNERVYVDISADE